MDIYKANLIDINYYDLDGDGIKDAIVLYQDEPANPYVLRLALSAVNSATKKHRDIALPFDFGLMHQTAQLSILPVKKEGQTALYAIAGGQYGGTVAHVGYAIAKYTKNGWSNLFAKYQDSGMTYALTMQDGPRATLALENGQRFTLIPTDLETYRASGWIDSSGKLTGDARVFDEHIGFSTLTFADEKGILTLRGSQEIRGLHKLDVLARLDTVWKYDGSRWSVSANIVPLSSTIQNE